MTPETPPTAASRGLPDEPKLYSPHIADAGDVKVYATMWPNKLGNWMRKEDHDAHAATLSRELAAKEGENVRLRGELVESSAQKETAMQHVRNIIHRAESAEQQLAEAKKEIALWKNEAAINAENFHVTNKALVGYDNKRIAAESQLAEHAARVNACEAAIEGLLENCFEPPDANCSCHLSPPCGDCVEYGALREAIANAKAALKGSTP